jgi:hypothetical protein
MPRVTKVAHARTAGLACGKCGTKIKKGDPYIWWKFMHSGKSVRCLNHYPRQSELTQSDKLSRAYAVGESIEDAVAEVTKALPLAQEAVEVTEALRIAVSDLADALTEGADEARSVGEEYGESADNIEQAFSSSSTADECREKADSLEEYASALENVDGAEALKELEGQPIFDWDKLVEAAGPDEAGFEAAMVEAFEQDLSGRFEPIENLVSEADDASGSLSL